MYRFRKFHRMGTISVQADSFRFQSNHFPGNGSHLLLRNHLFYLPQGNCFAFY